jgi:non-catalytic primase subunit PriX-like protein
VQRWDGTRPPINYLLRDYSTWLVAEKINEEKARNYRNTYSNVSFYNSTSNITWIEKLLWTPIPDHRKYAIWRIVIPYLFNVKNLSDDDVTNITHSWLDKCDAVRRLDFNTKYLIMQNIKNSKRHRFLPISFNKLNSENRGLYDIISRGLR